VEDEAVDAIRAAKFEISPTGPLFGYRVRLAEGRPGQFERALLAETGLTPEDWRRAGAHKVKGMRRPLRFGISEADATCGEDEHGRYLEIRFSAPAGSYATVVLREIMKVDPGS
jgi:tRNA pseudouridine13 synthase